MKKILTLCLCILSFSSFAATPHTACGLAVPSSDPSFCGSFQPVAYCHCMESGLGSEQTCSDMNALYQLMLDEFGNLEQACAFQQDVDYQTCVDDWGCYRNGGRNSAGELCSATGSACQ